MGYTHYYTGVKALTQPFIDDVERILAQAKSDGLVIRDGVGIGEPEISLDRIVLNGEAATDQDYETFLVTELSGFSFCKTARRPYDAVVTAILIALKVHGLVESVDSDGDWEDEWTVGAALYSQATGNRAVDPIDYVL